MTQTNNKFLTSFLTSTMLIGTLQLKNILFGNNKFSKYSAIAISWSNNRWIQMRLYSGNLPDRLPYYTNIKWYIIQRKFESFNVDLSRTNKCSV